MQSLNGWDGILRLNDYLEGNTYSIIHSNLFIKRERSISLLCYEILLYFNTLLDFLIKTSRLPKEINFRQIRDAEA